MQTIQAQTLTNYVQKLFAAAGAPASHAERVANSLVSANLAGHDSHGVIRTVQYLNNIKDGMLDPHATPAIVRETGVVTMVDGRRSFGQVAAHYAINIAIEKA
ncbi:MAG: Ldh family oxidoreductase, partial [Caldilineaceae bacterium]|nr:Ldh family oxidoreductase [Caldilineaceae bacterium]